MAEAYTTWSGVYHDYSHAVNLLQLTGTMLLAAFIILLSFERFRGLRRAVAAATALNHAAYLAAYTRAYDMKLTVLPLLDLLKDTKGHASLVIDVAQVMALYLALSFARERRRVQRTAVEELVGTE